MKTNPTLSPEDAALVDALLGEHATLPASARAERLHGWLNVLAVAPVPQAPADLAARTLARLHTDRLKLPTASPSAEPLRSRPFATRYLREFAAMAVAASILGVVITLGIGQARQSANRVACASNLLNVSNAFATYASTNHDQLPALAMPADHRWLDTTPVAAADSHSNDANLLPLVNASLLHPVNFLCPGRATTPSSDPDAARGYSYVDLCTPRPPHWDGRHPTIVLGDRNPLFDPAAALDPQSNDPQSNSANHARHGNYLVRADGSVTWETSPNVGPNHDNIWTLGTGPQYLTAYAGTETPASPNDVFLCP
jgi:hypothetical protein